MGFIPQDRPTNVSGYIKPWTINGGRGDDFWKNGPDKATFFSIVHQVIPPQFNGEKSEHAPDRRFGGERPGPWSRRVWTKPSINGVFACLLSSDEQKGHVDHVGGQQYESRLPFQDWLAFHKQKQSDSESGHHHHVFNRD